MRIPLVILAALSLVACGQSTATSRPDASTLPTATGTTSPSASAAVDLGTADAFVATLPQVAAVLTGALIVEAVAPDGRRVPVASIPNVVAGLPEGTTILEGEPIRVSPGGFLTIAVEGPFDQTAGGDPVARRLVFDLQAPARAPLVVSAGTPAWGPDGRLAITHATGVTLVDPASGRTTTIVDPEGVDAADVWAADGSGLLASRYDGSTDSSTAGVLGLDGTFAAGARPPWPATGRDRPYGADGAFVSDSVSDGATTSERAIIEQRAGQDTPLAWLIERQPGPDPAIVDHTWDAAGTGQWVTLGGKDTIRLVRIVRPTGSKPATPDEHATIASTVDATIAGVAPDNSAVILSMGDPGTATAGLFRLDTRAGTSVRIDEPGAISTFAGWATRP